MVAEMDETEWSDWCQAAEAIRISDRLDTAEAVYNATIAPRSRKANSIIQSFFRRLQRQIKVKLHRHRDYDPEQSEASYDRLRKAGGRTT